MMGVAFMVCSADAGKMLHGEGLGMELPLWDVFDFWWGETW